MSDASTPATLARLGVSIRPLVGHPAVLAVASALILATLAVRGLSADAVAWAVVQVVLVTVAAVDLASRRIPNVLIGGVAAAALVARLGFAHEALVETTIVGALCLVGFLLVAIASRGALGMGDVKLAGVLGLLLGLSVLPVLILGTIAGAVAAVVVARRAGSTKATLAYGPYLCLGAAVGILTLSLPHLV